MLARNIMDRLRLGGKRTKRCWQNFLPLSHTGAANRNACIPKKESIEYMSTLSQDEVVIDGFADTDWGTAKSERNSTAWCHYDSLDLTTSRWWRWFDSSRIS
eukprot:3917609-Amphidinium_carterae.6